MAISESVAENLVRQFDELEAIEAILCTEVEWGTTAVDVEALKAIAFSDDRCSASAAVANAQLDFTLLLPIDEGSDAAASAAASKPCRLRLMLPSGYPKESVPAVMGCEHPFLSRNKELADQLVAAAQAAVAAEPVGNEMLLTVVQEVSEVTKTLLQQEASGQREMAAMAAKVAAAQDGSWRRMFYWCDHLLQGKQHKKEKELMTILQGSGLAGTVWFGRPGIVALEGPQDEVEAAAHACGRAGKQLKVKNNQAMPGAAFARHFPARVSAMPAAKADSLDIDAVRQTLEKLGLERELKHILGLEDLAE
eukprot:TRINITY_DN42383_c0_g1_i1.p1 TRINITY_DN42383_c0_g1~~TRINITY_DN42383_c0_g1_i1.p1  ORF type:complete len:308 (+),score=75.71 TRINITY_DN42383_c0_g1_i1:13-936(+)